MLNRYIPLFIVPLLFILVACGTTPIDRLKDAELTYQTLANVGLTARETGLIDDADWQKAKVLEQALYDALRWYRVNYKDEARELAFKAALAAFLAHQETINGP